MTDEAKPQPEIHPAFKELVAVESAFLQICELHGTERGAQLGWDRFCEARDWVGRAIGASLKVQADAQKAAQEAAKPLEGEVIPAAS